MSTGSEASQNPPGITSYQQGSGPQQTISKEAAFASNRYSTVLGQENQGIKLTRNCLTLLTLSLFWFWQRSEQCGPSVYSQDNQAGVRS